MALHTSNIGMDTGRNLRRRKTRKGTRSCWECKRRKAKCIYASPADDVCTGCARRCLDCVGQEFPDQQPGPSLKSRLVGDRIGRLESMIQQLAEQAGGHVDSPIWPSTTVGIVIPAPHPTIYSNHRMLSQALLAAYPSPSDLRIIYSTGERLAVHLLQAFAAPSNLLERRVALEARKLPGAQQEDHQQQYTEETHPVLIARHMLLLAGVLQHLDVAGLASGHGQHPGELSQLPRKLARRLAEAAMTLVTAHDRLTAGTLKGMECLLLEAMYHEEDGRAHQSWLAVRRATSAMHLLGFHGCRYTPVVPPKSILQQPGSKAVHLQQTWLHLMHSEIALCLALEIPPSISCPGDVIKPVADLVATGDYTTDISRLQRRHIGIAMQLLKLRECDPDFEDLDAAHDILSELKKARSSMPSSWWHTAIPADQERDNDKQLFETMIDLREQILHSYLLLLANLPYMLQLACGEPNITTSSNGHQHHHNHSRNHRNHKNNNLFDNCRDICIEASRDLLHRFIHLRSCSRTASYFRLLDHYACQAAATLLLVYILDRHQMKMMTCPGDDDHQQYLLDRAMASEVIERMWPAGDEEERDGDDNMSYYSGVAARRDIHKVLVRLLSLETERSAVVVMYHKPSKASPWSSSNEVIMGECEDTLVLPILWTGLVSVKPYLQNKNIGGSNRSPLSAGMGCFPVVLDDETGSHGSNDDDEGNDAEAGLRKAMKLRRQSKWLIAPYMLRPV